MARTEKAKYGKCRTFRISKRYGTVATSKSVESTVLNPSFIGFLEESLYFLLLVFISLYYKVVLVGV